ncbi:hypothetical protein I2492_04025 [Budviciaceae bacterium CWB-B4]|uniref:Beta-ketoacyl synthase N-terminal domain-containing protein n=1 Tax=Limnobaculum xujianqingii TaxID=2738837 RepID=A0A9D7AGA3_9GAMM|nr:hypothetical protein [Limnobaculum xujianqingii]MBK5072183.1 hypothetical protein [Limnobaculum xujianqingii]MBK5175492.1 hypothetical protein [Limnobaculum xujianqingii]
MKSLVVLKGGMVTPVGFNAYSSCAAIRAGISGVGELYLMEYAGGINPLRGGKVDLPQWWDSLDKLVDLVSPAIWECLSEIPEEEHNNIPILLGVTLPETQFLGQCTDELLYKIEKKLNILHHPLSKLLPYGQSSGIKGINLASELLASKEISYCIVAGTDSYLQEKSTDYYIKNNRIITETNSNGFFPGEAGSAILLVSPEHNLQSGLHVIGIGEAKESAYYLSEKPFMANGMTQAIKQAINDAQVKPEKILCRLTDINGEHYKFHESNIAVGRLNTIGSEDGVDMDIWHPIEFTGEIGAAIVPLLLGLALDAGQKGYNPGKYLLFHVGNDKEDRGALITRYGPPGDE